MYYIVLTWILCGLFAFGQISYREYQKWGSIGPDAVDAFIACISLGPLAILFFIKK